MDPQAKDLLKLLDLFVSGKRAYLAMADQIEGLVPAMSDETDEFRERLDRYALALDDFTEAPSGDACDVLANELLDIRRHADGLAEKANRIANG
jgi:hypothetical protein